MVGLLVRGMPPAPTLKIRSSLSVGEDGTYLNVLCATRCKIIIHLYITWKVSVFIAADPLTCFPVALDQEQLIEVSSSTGYSLQTPASEGRSQPQDRGLLPTMSGPTQGPG